MATYQYPLEHQDDYVGRITFEAFKEPSLAAQLLNLKVPSIKEVSTRSGGRDQQGGNDPANTAVLKTEITVAELLGFTGQLTGSVSQQEAVRRTQGKVSLYMPQALQMQDAALYDNSFNLGPLGGMIASGAGASAINAAVSAGGIDGFMSKIVGNNGGDMATLAALEAAKYLPTLAGFAAGGVGGAIAGALTTGAILPAATVLGRVTTNPNTRTIFKSVPIRQFSFVFQMIPSSQKEANEIRKLIQFFRVNLYPEAFGAGGTIGLNFPNTFDIKVSYRNKELPGVKFLTCYLQSFTATYNTQMGSMHEDGNWNQVEISMMFTEIRALNKADIQSGY